jgi:hypothetical protein
MHHSQIETKKEAIDWLMANYSNYDRKELSVFTAAELIDEVRDCILDELAEW